MTPKMNKTKNLEQHVVDKITEVINVDTIDNVIQNYIVEPHLENRKMLDFHEYYFKILENDKYCLKKSGFFKEFVTKYGLKGLDKQYLKELESDKHVTLQYFMISNLDILFRIYFVKFNGSILENILFTKILHTFRPDEYTILDNNIRCYFNLENYDILTASTIVTHGYNIWGTTNHNLILKIFETIQAHENGKVFPIEKITYPKLLDMIFYSLTKKERSDK